MTNTYFDATGVLILETVTPVITALFEDFSLDPSNPGDGEAYIALLSDGNVPSWHHIIDNLENLVGTLSLSLPECEKLRDQVVLNLLARHFNVAEDVEIQHLIEHEDFDDIPDLHVLFSLAQSFNDGHGLKAIKIEGAWYCSKPRLFEFGGHGYYISRDVSIRSKSTLALDLGANLHAAILDGDAEQAAGHIENVVIAMLDGIKSDRMRRVVRMQLGEQLLRNDT